MPTRHGQTGWRHDSKAQKEFERIGRNNDAEIKRAVDEAIADGTPESKLKAKIRAISHNDEIITRDVTQLDFQDVAKPFDEGLTVPTFYETYGTDSYAKIKTFAKIPIRTGTVHINILPNNAGSYHARDAWKRVNRDVRPDVAYNWYGWAVYGVIDHGWTLTNPNDFILNLVDIDETMVGDPAFELDITEVYDYIVADIGIENIEDDALVAESAMKYYNEWTDNVTEYGAFTPKNDRPVVQGLHIEELVTIDSVDYTIEKDIIVLRGVHKPDVPTTYKTPYNGRLDYMDEAAGTLRTNLTFRYTLLRGS